MPKVIQNTLQAGPNGVISPGDIVDVSSKDAEYLVSKGYATYLKEAKKEEAVQAPVESTVDVKAEETTAVDEQPKPRRGRPSKKD